MTAPGTSRRSAVARPSRRDLALIVVGVVAVSTSAPLIAATAAPALAIAFWRNALGSLALAPFALTRHRAELAGLTRREWRLTGLGGLFLGLHFATWVPSLDLTSVASSTALLATQPAWSALIARLRGQAVPGRAWLGMAVAFGGVLVITGVDVSLSSRALVGDLLSIAGSLFAAAYVTAGSEARATVGTTTYTFLVYGTAAVLLLGLTVATRGQLTGYTARTWVLLVTLTAVAQLVGHTALNAALRTAPPTVLSLAILFEMPGAALIAAVWLGQVPPPGILPGAVLLLAGIAMVVRSQPRSGPVEVPPD